jgi:hypothetical protein
MTNMRIQLRTAVRPTVLCLTFVQSVVECSREGLFLHLSAELPDGVKEAASKVTFDKNSHEVRSELKCTRVQCATSIMPCTSTRPVCIYCTVKLSICPEACRVVLSGSRGRFCCSFKMKGCPSRLTPQSRHKFEPAQARLFSASYL